MLSGAAGTFQGLVGANARKMGAAVADEAVPRAAAAISAARPVRMWRRESIALPVDRPYHGGLERLRRLLRYCALFENSGERGFRDFILPPGLSLSPTGVISGTPRGPEGDFGVTLTMISNACSPASNYLLSRPSTVPHPSGALGQGTAVRPVGSANYTTIFNWIQGGC